MNDVELLSMIEKGKIVAAFVVALGVGAEFVGEFVSRPITRRIDAAHEAEMTRLNRDAAQAQKDTEQARKEAAAAGERAARANERAASLEGRAAELEADVQPRDLTIAQQNRLRESLKPFAGHVVGVRSYALDLEGRRFGRLLKSVFESVPMHVADNTGNLFNLAGNFIVGVRVAGPLKDKHLVDAIAAALSAEGNFNTTTLADETVREDALIEVMIGVKPLRKP